LWYANNRSTGVSRYSGKIAATEKTGTTRFIQLTRTALFVGAWAERRATNVG
jgi:hypothetical protein